MPLPVEYAFELCIRTFQANKVSPSEAAAHVNTLIVKPTVAITLEELTALNEIKALLTRNVLLPLQNPQLFTKAYQPPTGILFFGPPGCGKTMLASGWL